MANSAFGYTEVGQNSTMTATTEATGYDIERVYNFTPSSAWRSTAITIQRIVWDFGVDNTQLVKFVKWVNTNIKAGDTTYQFEAGTTTGTTDEAQALTKATDGFQLLDSGTGWDYRYFALEIVTIAPETYQEIGSFLLYADYYTFVKNFQVDRIAGDENLFIEVLAENANDFRLTQKYNRRVYSLTFEDVEAAQITIFNTIKTKPYVVFYEGIENEAYYGIANFDLPRFRSDSYQLISASFREVK